MPEFDNINIDFLSGNIQQKMTKYQLVYNKALNIYEDSKKVHFIYERAKLQKICTQYTFMTYLKIMSKTIRNLDSIKKIYTDILLDARVADVQHIFVVVAYMIKIYGTYGEIKAARELFDDYREKENATNGDLKKDFLKIYGAMMEVDYANGTRENIHRYIDDIIDKEWPIKSRDYFISLADSNNDFYLVSQIFGKKNYPGKTVLTYQKILNTLIRSSRKEHNSEKFNEAKKYTMNFYVYFLILFLIERRKII